jgi:hypothetical protein
MMNKAKSRPKKNTRKETSSITCSSVGSFEDTIESPEQEKEDLNVNEVKMDKIEMIEADGENPFKNVFKDLWNNQANAGGYQVKLSAVKYPSSSLYYAVLLDIINQSGQLQIYLKARTIVEVLKMFVIQVQKCFPTFADKLNITRFQGVINSGHYVEMHDASHGVNKYRASTKDGREYKDYIVLFMIPKHTGEQQKVIQDFKIFLFQVMSSTHFFYLVESYTRSLPDDGGKVGKHLRNKESDSWKILKNENNFVITDILSLDAKLMDEEIDDVLDKLFPGESKKAAYQKIGWKKSMVTVFEKSKKK